MAVTGPSNRQSAPIFKLTIDCCEEIFDYLSLKDLHSFGQTCRAMQKVAGEYFKRNFSGSEKFTHNDGIYTCYYDHEGASNVRTLTSIFNRYITNISYYYHDLRPLHYIESHSDELESVNSLYLVCTNVNERKIKHFQKILPKIEYVTLNQCTADGSFYDVMLQYCKNMTHLRILDDLGFIISSYGRNPWLLKHYPKLKSLHLGPRFAAEVHGLTTFFELNLNVQRFSITYHFLQENRDQLINSNAKLDTLYVGDFKYHNTQNMELICDLLKELYNRGFYKRLYLNFEKINQELCDQIGLLPGLEKLGFSEFTRIYGVPHMISLKELGLPSGLGTNDIEMLAKNLVNLETVTINTKTSNDLLPFMRFAKKLKKMLVYLAGGILNLPKLNKEREKLAGARNVIIYVEDGIFLATKWATHYGESNVELVEMRRMGSA